MNTTRASSVGTSAYVPRLRRAFLLQVHPDRFRRHSEEVRKRQARLVQGNTTCDISIMQNKKSYRTIAHVFYLTHFAFLDTKALSDRMAERDFLAYVTSSRLVLYVKIVCIRCAHNKYYLLINNTFHPPPYHQ